MPLGRLCVRVRTLGPAANAYTRARMPLHKRMIADAADGVPLFVRVFARLRTRVLEPVCSYVTHTPTSVRGRTRLRTYAYACLPHNLRTSCCQPSACALACVRMCTRTHDMRGCTRVGLRTYAAVPTHARGYMRRWAAVRACLRPLAYTCTCILVGTPLCPGSLCSLPDVRMHTRPHAFNTNLGKTCAYVPVPTLVHGSTPHVRTYACVRTRT